MFAGFFTDEENSMSICTFYPQIQHMGNYTKVRHKNYLCSNTQRVVEDTYTVS